MTVSLLRLRYILTYLLTAWRETTDLTMTIFHENVNSKSRLDRWGMLHQREYVMGQCSEYRIYRGRSFHVDGRLWLAAAFWTDRWLNVVAFRVALCLVCLLAVQHVKDRHVWIDMLNICLMFDGRRQ